MPATAVSDAHPCASPNWQVVPERLTFGPVPGSPSAVTLVVSQYGPDAGPSAAGGVATTQLTLQRILPSVDGVPFGWVVVAAGGFALLFLILALAAQADRAGGRLDLSAPVFASASWTFKDSWATNITAVGALLGTFLSASSSVASLFPGVPLYRFSIANASSGAIVVVVPLVVAVGSALTRRKTMAVPPPKNDVVVASFGAVLLGATLTMFAVGAELTLFGILVDVSSATSGWVISFLILLAVAAVVVLAYALMTTHQLKISGDMAAANLHARAQLRLAAAPGLAPALDDNDDVVVSSALARSADTSLTL